MIFYVFFCTYNMYFVLGIFYYVLNYKMEWCLFFMTLFCCCFPREFLSLFSTFIPCLWRPRTQKLRLIIIIIIIWLVCVIIALARYVVARVRVHPSHPCQAAYISASTNKRRNSLSRAHRTCQRRHPFHCGRRRGAADHGRAFSVIWRSRVRERASLVF